MACASTESGTGAESFAKAARTHGGGRGVDGFATQMRCASSTAPAMIVGPSLGSGQVCLTAEAEAAGAAAGVGGEAALEPHAAAAASTDTPITAWIQRNERFSTGGKFVFVIRERSHLVGEGAETRFTS